MKTRKFFQFFLIFAILAIFSSCRTVRVVEQVPVEVYDTVYQKMVHRDSTYIDRWHTIETKGDTVYVADSVWVVRYFRTTDTAYRYIERPVPVVRTEQVEVKKPLRWWQKGLMWCGAIGILIALAAVAVQILRRR